MNIPSDKVIRHYQKGQKEGSLDGDFIVTVYRGQGNKIYIGTWNSLFEYNRTKDNFKKVPYLNAQIQQVAQAKDGTLWVASYGAGIYYYNEKTGQHGHLFDGSKDETEIPSNYVNNITIDNTGKIWGATENGVFIFDPQTKKTSTFSDNYGFSHGQVFKIVQDNYQRYWISTSNGLYCYNAHEKSQKQYTKAYGLPSQQFNYNSGFKDKKGNLYFGTVNGMIQFFPPQHLDNDYLPPVFITGLKINNANSDSLLCELNTTNKGFHLNYNESSLNFDVSALTYSLPGTTKLLYKLENFDKDWNRVSYNGNIFYPNLPHGNYLLKIKNAEKNYDGSETSLAFTIKPPIWASLWAYILYSLIISGIIFLILRYYFLALKEKQKRILDAFENEKQKEIYASKIDFFTHVAHEIRTPLTLIKLPLEKLKEKNTLDEQSIQNITLMEKNTNRLIDLTNELLDFRKAESNNYKLSFTDVDITRLIQKSVDAFRPLAEQKSMHLIVEMPRLHLIASADAEAMQKILDNLVNNAIKYGEKTVNILLEPFGSDSVDYTLRVSSDGPLIPKDKINKIFEPFVRLEETAKEVGSGIGLPLSRALAKLHNGELKLDETGNMNTFILKMPIDQNETIHLHEKATEVDINRQMPDIEIDAHKASILLVEDNIDILNFVKNELIGDYNIFTVNNGEKALEMLDEVQIDLLVTDIMMPVMDGIELCKNIKEDMRFSHIPVIMLTAKNTLVSKIEGLETGADAYIEKPFSMDYLKAQIKNILQNRQILVKHFSSSPLAHIKTIGTNNKDKEFLDKLQNLINLHIMDENLDVKELAVLLNMSKATLYRKIKSISKLSPNELINITRLKRAAELLADGNYRINEVANMTGYYQQSNFSRDFSRQFGMSPTQFLDKIKNK